MIKTELQKVAEELNLTYNVKGKVMFGEYRGFKICVKENLRQMKYFIDFPIKALDLEQTENLNSFIEELIRDKDRINKVVYESCCLKVEVAMKRMAKPNINNVIELVGKISDFAKNNNCSSCCEVCGESIKTSVHLINGTVLYACDNCYSQTIKELDKLQESVKQKKGNFLTGIVGALLGSVIGIALWVAVYAFGYIAAICGIVLAVCIIKGYDLFGGKLDAVGIVITVVMTIAMVFVSTYLSYAYDMYSSLKETQDIDLITAVKTAGSIINVMPEIKRAFIGDLVLGYVFTAIGAVSVFINAYRSSNFKYSAEKINE